MQTPEFLLWSLEHTCPPRGDQDGSDPERSERQLRAARAVSDARREGRVLEGLAVDPPHGFRIADALTIYGGEAAVAGACGICPANGLPKVGSYAGCLGWVVLPADATCFHAVIDCIVQPEISATMPRWYGLWMCSPLAAQQLEQVAHALAGFHVDDARCQSGVSDLVAACRTAIKQMLTLHVRVYPAGNVEGNWWRLAPHCLQCKGAWRAAAGNCAICGFVGHPAPDKKRRARGKRPYFLLDRLLGAEQSAAFMDRYQNFRARQQSGDLPPDPPPPAPPDSPPAD